MNTIEAIKSRRSVRSFTNTEVPLSLVKELITVASHAPSAGNGQPWHFIVVDDRQLMNEMAQINRHGEMAREAPVGIVVVGNLDKERIPGFWSQDCAAVTQNLLLVAHDRGLGATWTGIYPVRNRVEGVKKLFMLPGNSVPFSFVVLGYPARRESLVPRSEQAPVHYNHWSDRATFNDVTRASSSPLERITRS